MSHKDWKFKALTDIWTGDAECKADRLIPTGLLGSIRWWFEVLVRGLGGKACDPTGDGRCPDPKVTDPTKRGHRCVVCELFGCTGWARKFRLMVLDRGGNIIPTRITSGTVFTLRFVRLRPIREEEWCLLECTLHLIAEYGAIGGKTVWKPSDETKRQNAAHHIDYGLIQCTSGPDDWKCEKSCEHLKNYAAQTQWRAAPHKYQEDGQIHDFSWASLLNFWCVKGRYLARQDQKQSTFNTVVGRQQDKSLKERKGTRVIRWSDLLEDPNDRVAVWLAGSQQESKKVFSFKHPQEGQRTFGFLKPGTVDFKQMKQRLKQVWRRGNFQDDEFLTGEEILKSLCRGQGHEL